MTAPGMLHGALRFSDHPRARVAPHRHLAGARRTRASSPSSRPPTSPASGSRARSRATGASSSPRARSPSYVGDVIAAVAAETRQAAPGRGGARRGRVRGARAGHRPVRGARRGRAGAARGRQRPLGLARAARRRRRRPRRRGPRRHARRSAPSSSSTPSSSPSRALAVPGRRRAARGLLAGPGRLGRPPPDRLVPRAPGGARARHPRADRRRLRRQGGPQRPGHAALLATSTGRPVLVTLTRKESLRFHSKRHAMWLDYTVGCDAEGRLLGGPRAHRRRHRRVRERRRQGARARRRPRLRRLRGRRTSTSRAQRSTPITRPAARCAASASTSRTSRSRACSTCSPSRSASTAGRSAGATRSRRASASAPARSSAPASA